MMGSASNSDAAQSLLTMLHHFGNFSAIAPDGASDSDLYTHTFSHHAEPNEWLQIMLDIVRCTYEPIPVGTLLLNGNPSYMADTLSRSNGMVAYTSKIMDVDTEFEVFHQQELIPALQKQGVDLSGNYTLFVIASSDMASITLPRLEEMSQVLNAGFTVDSFLQNLADNIDSVKSYHPESILGFCTDEALTDKMRVSVLAIGRDGPDL